jgi:hypothetical protein
VVHTPITDIEQLKHDSMAQLSNIERGDHVIIIVDSVGNLASRKEVEDAIDGKSVADMSRAKQLKSLFRMVTPHLTMKDIPMVVVNHTYKEIGLYPRDIVSGGTGVYYSADNIYIIGRQQDKDGSDLIGYSFIINVEKSRYVKEKSKIAIDVSFEGGISRWSGLLDVALEGGFVTKPSNGWYQRKGEEPKYRLKDTMTKDFWLPILIKPEFSDFVASKYQISSSDLMGSDLSEEWEDINSEYEKVET